MTQASLLTESITHLEDLDIQAFISAVSNIAKMQATEKLDGSNLQFGLDDAGRLFTTRAGKSKAAQNVYNEADYPYFSANNGFRSAHAALKLKEREIKSILQPGEMVEIEVLFGRQPNAVVYGANGKNYIAFLRGVNGTPDAKVDQLSSQLNNQTVKVKVNVVDTVDGVNLTLQPTELTFQFVGVQKLDAAELKKVNISKQLAELERFLKEPAGVPGSDLTNFQLVTSSLGSISKDVRPQAKQLKEKLLAKLLTDFKLPIKKELLDGFVKKIKSPLAAADATPDEDIGIEGVVLKVPGTDDQIKLVDKDTFTTINQFNHAVRKSISGTVKTTDSSASLESRGGIVGELKILVADLLGNRDLARSLGARKVFQTLKGPTPEATLKNVAGELSGGDDYLGTKRKVLALIGASLEKLDVMLKDFKAHKDDYRLKLKDGKSIGLSPEIIRRTLLTFAETKRDLDELKDKVGKTKNLRQLVAVMYGKGIQEVHRVGETEPVSEGLLLEKNVFTDKAQYQGKDAWQLLNVYFVNVMLAALIYRADDALGIRALRDKPHCALKSWNRNMSPLNFWGYAVWRCGQPAVAKLIGRRTARELFQYVRRIPKNSWRFLHLDFSFGKERAVAWEDHRKVLKVLQQLPGMGIDRINQLLDGVFNYHELTFDEKVKLLSKLYYYIMQFNAYNPLLPRFHAIQRELLMSAPGQDVIDPEEYKVITEMKLLRSVVSLAEEDAAGPSAPGGGAPAGPGVPVAQSNGGPSPLATTAGGISSYQQPLFGTKPGVVLRRRTDWKPKKFANPYKVDKK